MPTEHLARELDFVRLRYERGRIGFEGWRRGDRNGLPPRVKKYKLPVKRNILASKAFCLLEGVVTPLSLSKRLLGAKEWLVFEPFAE